MEYTEPADRAAFVQFVSAGKFNLALQRKTAQDFVTEIRAGETTLAQIINTVMLQDNKAWGPFAKELGVSHMALRKWREGEGRPAIRRQAETLADYIGFTTPDERADFINFALGKPLQPHTPDEPRASIGTFTAMVNEPSHTPKRGGGADTQKS
jgi:DNA-binding transcriptional regulator YiaG